MLKHHVYTRGIFMCLEDLHDYTLHHITNYTSSSLEIMLPTCVHLRIHFSPYSLFCKLFLTVTEMQVCKSSKIQSEEMQMLTTN
jgi:hypothetical protein